MININLTPKNKIIIFSFIILALFVGFVIYYLIPKTNIKFLTSPNDIYITLDNQPKRKITNKQTIPVSPGDHSIVFSADQFSETTKTINIKEGTTFEVVIALNPLSSEAEDLVNNTDSIYVQELYYAQNMNEEVDKMMDQNPIMNILPIYARLYTITSCTSVKYPKDITKIALCINTNQKKSDIEPYITKHLSTLGYDIDDFDVVWSFSE